MIVYADMVADLFHKGHLEFLKKCRNIAGQRPLVIGIHNDDDVASYKRRPVQPMSHRADTVRSLKMVDRVVEDAPVILTKEYLEKIGAAVVVHGTDGLGDPKCQQMYAVPEDMGIMVYVKSCSGVTTTQIIEKVKNAY